MKAHEIKVKNKSGKEITVTVPYYEANQGELTSLMDAKETKTYCDAYHKAKADEKKKMEAEQLKNKSA